MASRSSAGVGVGVTIAILGVACLGLFILTIVFLSKFQAAERRNQQADADLREFVTAGERQTPQVRAVVDRARQQAPAQSAVTYLRESLRTLSDRAIGAKTDDVGQVVARLDNVQGLGSQSLLAFIEVKQRAVEDAESRLAAAEAARDTALRDRENEANRVQNLRASHAATITSLEDQINAYRAEIDTYRDEINVLRGEMDARVDRISQAFEGEKATLNAEIARLRDSNTLLADELEKLRSERNRDIFRGDDERTLVDGEIIGVDPNGDNVYINRGRNDKVVLGLSFSVYADAAELRPDASGNLARGKADLEVIKVDESSSTCRIVRSTRGLPVVRGDLIVNPIYDPKKVYKFLVYGNFDSNGDGRADELERHDIGALIEQWGGATVDQLVDGIDFLVLGERPVVPPPPKASDPIYVQEAYIRIVGFAREYDRLFEQATATSIPVLNQNRLYTLIGKSSSPIR